MSYYAPTAYNSKKIPEQPAQVTPPKSFSVLDRASSIRLPWGNTKDIAPSSFIDSGSPKKIRAREEFRRKHNEEELEDYHICIDHERYRHASFSFRTLFWGYLTGCGKAFFFIALPVLTATFFLTAAATDESFEAHTRAVIPMLLWVLAVPLSCWIIGSSVIRWFPDWVNKPAAGPKWELNRRTGMVTLFKYKRRFPFGKATLVGEECAPFYEFDAYAGVMATPQGLPYHHLYFVHRYRPIQVDIDLLGGVSNRQDCLALWDLWQNFMDISQPLPDVPLWEEYRHLDPTTAEHDRRIGRPPRYWRDMDDKTYERKILEIRNQVHYINTLSRYNLMDQFVDYCS